MLTLTLNDMAVVSGLSAVDKNGQQLTDDRPQLTQLNYNPHFIPFLVKKRINRIFLQNISDRSLP